MEPRPGPIRVPGAIRVAAAGPPRTTYSDGRRYSDGNPTRTPEADRRRGGAGGAGVVEGDGAVDAAAEEGGGGDRLVAAGVGGVDARRQAGDDGGRARVDEERDRDALARPGGDDAVRRRDVAVVRPAGEHLAEV